MELWDLYDENKKLLNEELIRGEPIPDNRFHLVVHVWIRNSNNEYLISQRAADRPTFPLMWECPGGSVIKGENSLSGALREVEEEIGVRLQEENGYLLFTKLRKKVNGKKYNDILDVWLFDYDGQVDLDAATTDEVVQAKWMTIDEIKDLFDKGLFVPSLEYFFTEIANAF